MVFADRPPSPRVRDGGIHRQNESVDLRALLVRPPGIASAVLGYYFNNQYLAEYTPPGGLHNFI